MARGKGSVPGTGEKKAAWGHTELAAVVYSARKREGKKKCFHVPASLGRKKG